MAMNKRDAGLLHERLHARTQLLHNLLLALNDFRELHGLAQLSQFGIVAERLRRYAPAVQAGASGKGTFHNHHLQAVLGRIFGSTIATRATADDQ